MAASFLDELLLHSARRRLRVRGGEHARSCPAVDGAWVRIAPGAPPPKQMRCIDVWLQVKNAACGTEDWRLQQGRQQENKSHNALVPEVSVTGIMTCKNGQTSRVLRRWLAGRDRQLQSDDLHEWTDKPGSTVMTGETGTNKPYSKAMTCKKLQTLNAGDSTQQLSYSSCTPGSREMLLTILLP